MDMKESVESTNLGSKTNVGHHYFAKSLNIGYHIF